MLAALFFPALTALMQMKFDHVNDVNVKSIKNSKTTINVVSRYKYKFIQGRINNIANAAHF